MSEEISVEDAQRMAMRVGLSPQEMNETTKIVEGCVVNMNKAADKCEKQSPTVAKRLRDDARKLNRLAIYLDMIRFEASKR